MENPDAKLKELFSGGHLIKVPRADVILSGGDTPDGVYYIESGAVKVYTITDQGTENLHIIYRPGEIFPLVWAIKGIIRDVFYEAFDQVTLYRLPRERFLEAAQTNPRVAFEVTRQAVDQFWVYTDRVDNLELGNAQQRLVYRLLFLAARFGQRTNDGIIIHLPITHHQIASSINIARETASREMERLEHEGLIRHQDKFLVVCDARRLADKIGDNVHIEDWGLS